MTILAKKTLKRIEIVKEMFGVFTRRRQAAASENFSHLNMVVFARDPISREILEYGFFEHEELSIILNFLRSKELTRGFALDVGANIGNHSLYFDSYYDGVYAFEPHPLTFKILELNSKLGNNIIAKNIGASDNSGELSLVNELYSLGGASLHAENYEGRKDIQISRITVEPLDSIEYLLEKDISLIKIDVEGHELQVLKGCKELINRNKPVLMFEQHLRDFSGDDNKVLNFIKDLGYSKFAVVHRRTKYGVDINNIKNMFLKRLLIILWGCEIRLELTDEIRSSTYPIILALPPGQ